MAVTTTSPPLTLTSAAALRALPFSLRVRRREYWAWVRFVVFGRAVPATLFGFMGWIQLNHVAAGFRVLPSGAAVGPFVRLVLPSLLYTLFCAVPVGLYLTRPAPAVRDGRLVARTAAFTGTLMQLVVGAFLPAGPLLLAPPGWAGQVSAVLTLGAYVFALLAMAHLRRNLSIIPEARRLVTSGPYRLVRHPLYLAEVTAAAGLVLSWPAAVPTVAFAVFVVMQVVRARFEEGLLRGAFAEYGAYARRTRRLLPFVW